MASKRERKCQFPFNWVFICDQRDNVGEMRIWIANMGYTWGVTRDFNHKTSADIFVGYCVCLLVSLTNQKKARESPRFVTLTNVTIWGSRWSHWNWILRVKKAEGANGNHAAWCILRTALLKRHRICVSNPLAKRGEEIQSLNSGLMRNKWVTSHALHGGQL